MWSKRLPIFSKAYSSLVNATRQGRELLDRRNEGDLPTYGARVAGHSLSSYRSLARSEPSASVRSPIGLGKGGLCFGLKTRKRSSRVGGVRAAIGRTARRLSARFRFDKVGRTADETSHPPEAATRALARIAHQPTPTEGDLSGLKCPCLLRLWPPGATKGLDFSR